jgi:hypothetical protein
MSKKLKPNKKQGYKKYAGVTKVNDAATSLGYEVGRALERRFPIAKAYGARSNLARAASGISRVFGYGDYTIANGGSTEHILTNSLVKGGPPKFG